MKEKLLRWIFEFQKRCGDLPRTIPATVDEIVALDKETPEGNSVQAERWAGRFNGIDVCMNEFGPDLRQKILELPLRRFSESAEIDPAFYTIHKDYQSAWNRLRLILDRSIATNTSDVEVKCKFQVHIPDPWGNLKRKLHVTSWFPINERVEERIEVCRIKATVLYPFINVKLPQNTHYVRLIVTQ